MKKDKAYKEFRRFTDYMAEFSVLYNKQERKLLADIWLIEYRDLLHK